MTEKPKANRTVSWAVGAYRDAVGRRLERLRDEKIIERIGGHDHTVWKTAPTEITNRLGWLHSAGVISKNIRHLTALADEIRAEGCRHVILLGMGGSILAPEVLGSVFGRRSGYPSLTILDSTNPEAVTVCARRFDPARSLFIVATKSGTTVETLSFFKFFYNRIIDALGREEAGKHFIAITDPGTPLAELADRYRFRATFFNDPDVGGRYSALSCFGLVPAALIGVDLKVLLDRAAAVVSDSMSPDSEATLLGCIIGELALAGRDKMTLISSPGLEPFGNWVEQLVAESTGKEGRGVLPVIGEPLDTPDVYGNDRFFVHLRLGKDKTSDKGLSDLERAGYPVITIPVLDRFDLGGQFFLWEMAVGVAGWCLEINPFDQPDVESSKALARRMVDDYKENGTLIREEPSLIDGDIMVFRGPKSQGAGGSLISFIEERMKDGAYVAIQAYLPHDLAYDKALHTLRLRLRDRFGIAVTVGYGPRFLHSTGQLHKGDAGMGLFVQITADDVEDLPIPEEPGSPASSITFGILNEAQAAGDRQALQDAGRRVMRFHLKGDRIGMLLRLAEALV